MHTRRTMLAGAAAILAAPALAQPRTLRLMFQGAPLFVAAYTEMARRFEAANPGVSVQLIHAPHNEYNERVAAAVAARDVPEVLHLDAPFLANYAWSNILRPCAEFLPRTLLDDMTPSNVDQCTYPIDNQLYAFGLVDSTVLIFANRDYLRRVEARIPAGVDDAWTRAEFEAVMERLAGLPGVRWPLDTLRGTGPRTEWITYGLSPVFQSMGADLIDRRRWRAGGTLDGEAAIATGTMIQGWTRRNWIVPGSAGTNQLFAAGNPAAMAINGHWMLSDAGPSMGDNLVVLPLPKFGARSVSPNGTWIWGITRTARDPALAGRLIAFLAQDEPLRDVLRSRNAFPGLRSFAAASPNYAPGGKLAVGIQQAERTALKRPPHPAYPTITLAFMEAMDAIYANGNVQQALRRAARRIDDEIADNNGFPPFNRG
jgi:multiple sugar transport system substrate-binding protein